MTRFTVTPPAQGSTAGRPAVAAAPREVSGWELVAPVSEGVLARTYRARPASGSPGRPPGYIVKMLRRRWWDQPQAVALIRREAHVGMRVSNRHLISVLAAGVDRPPYYLVMPRLDGVTLAERLGSGPVAQVGRQTLKKWQKGTVPFSLRENWDSPQVGMDLPVALWTVRQVAEALSALWAAGWTHGDVKPANIFLSPEGHVTLLDLGFARRPRETISAARRPVMGTCRYLAPEAITSALAVDIRSDIYSLGAVLFEILAGRPPFEAEGLAELASAHRTARPPQLRKLVPHLPSDVARLVAQMLAKQPLRRPQTPAELIERLTALEIATFTERSF